MSRVGRIPRTEEEKERTEKGLCIVCGKPASKRSKVFCSNDCKNSWWSNHDWSWVRAEILHRDNLKCSKCGFQLKQIEYYYIVFNDPEGFSKNDLHIVHSDPQVMGYIAIPLVVDHIKPIALGGGEFDRSNLQILCQWCNKIKTANDMAMIAKDRRVVKTIGRNGKPLTSYLTVRNKQIMEVKK